MEKGRVDALIAEPELFGGGGRQAGPEQDDAEGKAPDPAEMMMREA
ncbi:hypothetical protein ACFSKM_11730 [Ancylobacter dichloromethanicus]